MLKYTSNIVVCLNKYDTDDLEEINIIEKFVKSKNVEFAISSAYSNGGNGAIELAEKVVNICNQENDFKMLYDTNLSIYDKIETICREIYHASNINYSDKAIEKINNIENIGMDKLPVCIAKTQYSISDNKDLLGYPKNYSVTVRDITLYAGAGFITVYLGDIMTMPGLNKHANYERIDIDSDGNIVGLS